MSATIARPKQDISAHWYHPVTGYPCHWVPKAKGDGDRPTTIRDARRLGLLPSVTNILKVANKPALTQWQIEMAVLAVLTAPRHDQEPLDTFIKRVLHDERQQDQVSQQARELGSDIHAEIESRLNGGLPNSELDPYVVPAINKALELGQVVISEKVVVGDGYAGKLDLAVQGHDIWILDFKSTSSLPKGKAWPEASMQLSAYAKAFGNTGDIRIRCGNIYISTKEPGEIAFFETEDWPTVFEQGFKPLLAYWQWLNDYRP